MYMPMPAKKPIIAVIAEIFDVNVKKYCKRLKQFMTRLGKSRITKRKVRNYEKIN